jgi:hypothetical protein
MTILLIKKHDQISLILEIIRAIVIKIMLTSLIRKDKMTKKIFAILLGFDFVNMRQFVGCSIPKKCNEF